ncbi:MAG: hypothetical protein GOU99_01415 [Candidatus Altiarchaeota archaeon]|nr:hypothetical protein [Candidatus Altiarchaeota archaeon]
MNVIDPIRELMSSMMESLVDFRTPLCLDPKREKYKQTDNQRMLISTLDGREAYILFLYPLNSSEYSEYGVKEAVKCVNGDMYVPNGTGFGSPQFIVSKVSDKKSRQAFKKNLENCGKHTYQVGNHLGVKTIKLTPGLKRPILDLSAFDVALHNSRKYADIRTA